MDTAGATLSTGNEDSALSTNSGTACGRFSSNSRFSK